MTPANAEAKSSADERPKTRPKQAMIRGAQQTALDELARELHDARSVKGERITANTLIRVAIDGIVPYGGRLHGDTEEQLLTSWLEFLERAAAVSSLQPRADELARELQGAGEGGAAELTGSTLVRVAFEGLLAHQGRLRGRSEEELTASWLAFLEDHDAPKGAPD